MTAKEQLTDVLDLIGENEAKELLLYIKATFTLKPKTWADIAEDDPTEDERTAFREYYAAKMPSVS